MARTGKIARLPPLVFEEFNERLLANHVVRDVLEWVNALPDVQAMLERLFKGEPINDQNVSIWRDAGGGFEEWKGQRVKLDYISKLASLGAKMAEAAGGRFAKGFLPVAVGKIHEALEEGQSVELDEKGKPFVTGIGADKLGRTLAALAKVEQDEERLKLDREKAQIDRAKLDLDVKKFQRSTAELFIAWCEDERAKEIALGAETKDTKVAKLIQLWFGEMPDNIGPAEFRKPAEAAAK